MSRLLRTSRARAATLYLPPPADLHGRALLVHEGEAAPLPELADPEAAEQFCRGLSDANLAHRDPVESGGRGGWLIALPALDDLLSADSDGEARRSPGRRRHESLHPESGPTQTAWLGLQFDADTSASDRLPAALSVLRRDRASGWHWLVAVGGVLAWHGQHVSSLLREPVSRLPGRTSLHGVLRAMLAAAARDEARVALLLVNPDAFALVNERFGREAGDGVIREIAGRLERALRQTDFVCRYGGAVFGVALPDAGEREIETVAAKLRDAICRDGFLDGALRLSTSFGGASHAPDRDEDLTEAMLRLVRRADRALNSASKSGGGRTVIWRRDRELEEIGQFDRLSGIFTANPSKDYRNMMLLWDTVHAVASSDDVARLIDRVLERLVAAFNAARVMLVEHTDAGGYGPARAASRGGERGAATEGERRFAPDHELRALLDQASLERRALERPLSAGRLGCAVPLASDDRRLGLLYLEGDAHEFQLDSSDRILLGGLAGQLAIALDRARLAEAERLRLDDERRTLRRELSELRRALGDAKLVHRSEAMDAVLDVARRVAPTDATVLICGESGTGKELVARTIHALSARRDGPLVVVDCSAIAVSLIDSELFGHEKGAYTGAERGSTGRLAEADGGTILLDEIGELPLEVQGKLLRFVQDRQFVAVGGTRPRRVDVRLIAATNRDLAAEVKIGRFREDLYYRLMVVQLTVPPLRERPEDVVLLARHFVDSFALQYGRQPRRLTAEAEVHLTAQGWPGNVRELQNRVMQAVILSRQERIGVDELTTGRPTPARTAADRAAGTAVPAPAEAADGDAWDTLRAVLRQRIALAANAAAPPPIGRWVADDLILEAHRRSGRVAAHAARALGIAKTTFRRRLRKAAIEAERGTSPRPNDWAEVLASLARIVAAANDDGEDRTRRVRLLLLEEVERRVTRDTGSAALLMGVSDPTYGRWVAELAG
ncbi:MAG TPA: sigma 54-interacting transcriptional regulator [Candidatus Polarisedimenticolaceae bacterium]|nr:sigma 54-interacting transcriptional regulator [Candidatus Polarisedimenticolaceae bacterium]